jgi:hypothetical protein
MFLFSCSPTIPTPPDDGGITIPDTPGTDKKVEDLFSKFKIITNADNITVNDVNGSETQFNILLNRQIETLTKDILYRLNAVYGIGAIATDDDYEDYLGNSYSLMSEPYNAYIGNYYLIDKPSNFYENAPVYYYENGTEINQTLPIINDSNVYSHYISNGTWMIGDQYGNPLTYFLRNINTINGGYEWDINNVRFSNTTINSLYSWEWSTYYSGNEFNQAAFDKLKEDIASLLAKGVVDETLTYDNALNQIDHLGYLKNDRKLIEDYVLNEIIGENNVDQDGINNLNLIKLNANNNDKVNDISKMKNLRILGA